MKKIIIAIAVIAFVPSAAYGAQKIFGVMKYENYDYFAYVADTKYGSLQVYRIEDEKNPTVKCYVMANDGTKFTEGGLGISCVNVPKEAKK